MKIDLRLGPRISGLIALEWVSGVVCYTLGKNSRNNEMAGKAEGFCEDFFLSKASW